MQIPHLKGLDIIFFTLSHMKGNFYRKNGRPTVVGKPVMTLKKKDKRLNFCMLIRDIHMYHIPLP